MSKMMRRCRVCTKLISNPKQNKSGLCGKCLDRDRDIKQREKRRYEQFKCERRNFTIDDLVGEQEQVQSRFDLRKKFFIRLIKERNGIKCQV